MKKFNSIFLLLILTNSVLASSTPCPVLNEETVKGVWEAIYTQDTFRVFRLEIHSDYGVLTQGLSYGNTIVSKMESSNVKNGNVELHFSRDSKSISVMVSGEKYQLNGNSFLKGLGRVCEDDNGNRGVLEATLVMEPHIPKPSTWDLRFIQTGKNTLSEEVNEMAKLAKEAAQNAQR